MPRYNTSLANKTITGTTTIVTPDSGSFVQLAGSAPYTVTLPAASAFPGQNFTFHNTTSGVVTVSTPSGNFVGAGAPGTGSYLIPATAVLSITSDSANYTVISEDGSPLTATTGAFSSNVTMDGAGATVNISPQTVTINPGSSGTVDRVSIGGTVRSTAAFTTLTANAATTLTANTASSNSSSGTLVVTGGVGVTGNINSGGTVSAVGLTGPLTGTIQTAAQPNITSVGALSGLTVTNTITGSVSGSAATVTTAAQPNITSVGTLTGLTVTNTITGSVSGSANTAGTVTAAAQPNITSVGTLTALTVSGILSVSQLNIGSRRQFDLLRIGDIASANDLNDQLYRNGVFYALNPINAPHSNNGLGIYLSSAGLGGTSDDLPNERAAQLYFGDTPASGLHYRVKQGSAGWHPWVALSSGIRGVYFSSTAAHIFTSNTTGFTTLETTFSRANALVNSTAKYLVIATVNGAALDDASAVLEFYDGANWVQPDALRGSSEMGAGIFRGSFGDFSITRATEDKQTLQYTATFIHAPATAATTLGYRVRCTAENANGFWLNRPTGNDGGYNTNSGISTMLIIELTGNV